MADYRSWCHNCGNEITFGSHASDCAGVARVKAKLKERDDAEDAAHAAMREMTDEQIIEELLELHLNRIALDEELTRTTRRHEFVRSYVFREGGGFQLIDRFKEKLKERGYKGEWW